MSVYARAYCNLECGLDGMKGSIDELTLLLDFCVRIAAWLLGLVHCPCGRIGSNLFVTQLTIIPSSPFTKVVTLSNG